MLRLDCVAIDLLPAEVAVEGVQVEAMPPGNQRERLFGVGAQLVGGARLARVVAGRGQSAAKPIPNCSNPPTSSPCQQCREMGTWRAARAPRRRRRRARRTVPWRDRRLGRTNPVSSAAPPVGNGGKRRSRVAVRGFAGSRFGFTGFPARIPAPLRARPGSRCAPSVGRCARPPSRPSGGRPRRFHERVRGECGDHDVAAAEENRRVVERPGIGSGVPGGPIRPPLKPNTPA